jgi:hypothetical protein
VTINPSRKTKMSSRRGHLYPSRKEKRLKIRLPVILTLSPPSDYLPVEENKHKFPSRTSLPVEERKAHETLKSSIRNNC